MNEDMLTAGFLSSPRSFVAHGVFFMSKVSKFTRKLNAASMLAQPYDTSRHRLGRGAN